MADKIKKFFAKKKMEAKFKLAGPGHKLTDTPSVKSSGNSSKPKVVRSQADVCEESKVAAAAALARLGQKRENSEFNTSLAAIKAQVRKELENEKEDGATLGEAKSQEDRPARNMAASGVYFKCPMISNDILPRDEWKLKMKEFLYEQLEHERGLTACLIIHSCNSNKEKVEICVSTLCKYLENIVSYPEEEKYRKIRMSNRAFTDRVQCVEGSMDFLQAAGFTQQTQKNPDGEEEQYLVFSEENVPSVESLITLIDALRSAEPIQLELDRNVQVLLPSQALANRELPSSFYSITPEELKRELQMRAEATERSQQLRTKAMREKDAMREMRKYKFALVRVRFPDGILLQGTFSVYERYSEIHEFVQEHLEHSGLPFILNSPTGLKLTLEEDSNKTLLDLKLVPTSVLAFAWDPSVIEEINNSPNKDVFLKPEVMILVQELNH